MKPSISIVYSFFVGGLLALIAQAVLTIWQLVLAGTPMEFFSGGATLVSMGVIGCILGGFAVYQYVEEWADFGALLPFSGFAMAVGMKAIGPWTKSNETFGKCVWNCVWFVVWFNVVFAAICIALGFLCGSTGLHNPLITIEATKGGMLFVWAFVFGGIFAAFFQIVFILVRRITSKAQHVHILMAAWMVGAILAPLGISSALAALSGEGFSVMILVGGYNMYNVGLDFAIGHSSTALLHLGSFLLAVAGLAITALFTFIIYNAKFGRTPIREVHKNNAINSLHELGFEIICTDEKIAVKDSIK